MPLDTSTIQKYCVNKLQWHKYTSTDYFTFNSKDILFLIIENKPCYRKVYQPIAESMKGNNGKMNNFIHSCRQTSRTKLISDPFVNTEKLHNMLEKNKKKRTWIAGTLEN